MGRSRVGFIKEWASPPAHLIPGPVTFAPQYAPATGPRGVVLVSPPSFEWGGLSGLGHSHSFPLRSENISWWPSRASKFYFLLVSRLGSFPTLFLTVVWSQEGKGNDSTITTKSTHSILELEYQDCFFALITYFESCRVHVILPFDLSVIWSLGQAQAKECMRYIHCRRCETTVGIWARTRV